MFDYVVIVDQIEVLDYRIIAEQANIGTGQGILDGELIGGGKFLAWVQIEEQQHGGNSSARSQRAPYEQRRPAAGGGVTRRAPCQLAHQLRTISCPIRRRLLLQFERQHLQHRAVGLDLSPAAWAIRQMMPNTLALVGSQLDAQIINQGGFGMPHGPVLNT